MSTQHPRQYTVLVRNFKDDPTGDTQTSHGVFTDETLPDAHALVTAILDAGLTDFLSATVTPVHEPSIESIVAAQNLHSSFANPVA